MISFNIKSDEKNNLTDYSDGLFIEHYQEDNAIYYASFHPEFYAEEDGLENTQRYLIILLQPSGLNQFYVVFQDDKWVPDFEDKNIQQVDQVLNNILNVNNKEQSQLEERNFPLLVSEDKLEWISDCIIDHTA